MHLADWPVADPALADPDLDARMAAVRRLCSAGRAARASARIGLRQPLARAFVDAEQLAWLGPELTALIAADLNVREVQPLPFGPVPASDELIRAHQSGATVAIDPVLTPDLRRAGYARQLIRRVQRERQRAGLNPHERIEVAWCSSDHEVAAAIQEHAESVGAAVRGGLTGPSDGGADDGAAGHVIDDLRLSFWMRPAASR